MRNRLILAFVLVSLALILAFGLVRGYSLSGELRVRSDDQAHAQAKGYEEALRMRLESGEPVDTAWLDSLVGRDAMLVYDPVGGESISVTGREFAAPADLEGAVRGEADVEGNELMVILPVRPWQDALGYNVASVLVLVVLILLLAAVAGWLTARVLAAPFTKLADAAEMLGRGRFDLDLPRTGVPEVEAVSAALEASASALRDRLAREQQFSTHASHVLRTPLTGLRLHLDELDQEPLGPGARAATQRCLASVDQLDQVVADLVDITRRGTLMSGAAVPLRELATSSAQGWADVLISAGRSFSAAVDGDLDLTLTPGPVEYVLDVLLEQAQRDGEGDVRLVFIGAPTVLRIEVAGVVLPLEPRQGPADEDGPVTPLTRADQAASLVRSLGGRLERLADGSGTVVLIPPR